MSNQKTDGNNTLEQNKREFVKWVKTNVKARSVRRHLLENAAYYFANAYFDSVIEAHRREIEVALESKMKVDTLFQNYQQQVQLDSAQFGLAMTELASKQTSLNEDVVKLLEPRASINIRLDEIRQRERLELLTLKSREKRDRFVLRAATCGTAERTVVRAQFETEIRQELSDGETIQKILDEYDLAIAQIIVVYAE